MLPKYTWVWLLSGMENLPVATVVKVVASAGAVNSSSAKSGASEALNLSVLVFLTGLKLCNIVAFYFKQSLVKEQSRALVHLPGKLDAVLSNHREEPCP